MSKLTGKVAVVTGAPKGIGAAIAKSLAAAGASVIGIINIGSVCQSHHTSEQRDLHRHQGRGRGHHSGVLSRELGRGGHDKQTGAERE